MLAKCRNIYCTPCKVNHGWFTCPDPKCGYNDNITLKAFSLDKVGEIIKCECGIKYRITGYDPNVSRDIVELEVYEGDYDVESA